MDIGDNEVKSPTMMEVESKVEGGRAIREKKKRPWLATPLALRGGGPGLVNT